MARGPRFARGHFFSWLKPMPIVPFFVSFSFFVFFVPILFPTPLYDLGPGSRRDERNENGPKRE
jgi:hypothetical protein